MIRSLAHSRRTVAAFVPPTPLTVRAPSRALSSLHRPRAPPSDRRPRALPARRAHTAPAMTAPLTLPEAVPASAVGRSPVFAQVMLRINSPAASDAFYARALGMKLMTRLDFADFKFSLFFYAYTVDDPPDPDSLDQPARAAWLWARPEPTVELTWNWPADTLAESLALDAKPKAERPAPDEVYVSGNDEPQGFARLALTVSDVDAAATALRAAAVPFVAEPAPLPDGRAALTVSDPDGYHVQIAARAGAAAGDAGGASLATLQPVFAGPVLRIKDARQAVPFFQRLGFRLVHRGDDAAAQTSTFGLAYTETAGMVSDASTLRAPVLSLVQRWGVEDEPDQPYTNGNVKPYRGYGHVGIIVDDIYATCKTLETDGFKIVRQPSPFADAAEIGFVAEPSTDYWVEIIKRAGTPADAPYEQPLL